MMIVAGCLLIITSPAILLVLARPTLRRVREDREMQRLKRLRRDINTYKWP